MEAKRKIQEKHATGPRIQAAGQIATAPTPQVVDLASEVTTKFESLRLLAKAIADLEAQKHEQAEKLKATCERLANFQDTYTELDTVAKQKTVALCAQTGGNELLRSIEIGQ